MLDSSIPAKFVIIFASAAPAGDVTSPIPTTAQAGGLVSFPTGWQEINFTPVDAGGVPPFGKDFNGLFQVVSQWLQWYQAGGPVTYDATFQANANVNGYPNGAIVQSATVPGKYWRSSVDNNLTNPDTGGAGWAQWPFPIPLPIADGGTNNAGPFALGSVVFSDGSKLTQDNSNFYWLDSLHRLGIGTNAPGAALDVRGDIAASGTVSGINLTVISPTSGSGLGINAPNPTINYTNTLDGNTWSVGTPFPAGVYQITFNTAPRMSLDQAGNMIIQGTLTQGSDIALKSDVVDLESVLDRVRKLRPSRYRRRETGREEVGLIAQQVRELFPELVYGNEGDFSIAYGNLTVILLRALQELESRSWWRQLLRIIR